MKDDIDQTRPRSISPRALHETERTRKRMLQSSAKDAYGFTLVEIMIVVAIIGMLASIAIPNFIRARANSQAQVCISNLRLIDQAKQVVLLSDPAATLDRAALQPHIGRGAGSFPVCPMTALDGGASYVIGGPDEKPYCRNPSLPAHALP